MQDIETVPAAFGRASAGPIIPVSPAMRAASARMAAPSARVMRAGAQHDHGTPGFAQHFGKGMAAIGDRGQHIDTSVPSCSTG